MATIKTATLTIRVDPDLKEALRVAAQAEHRSIANCAASKKSGRRWLHHCV